MKCIVPNQNVKIIARAIHSLSKIGDEMFIEPMHDEITFRTVNMAQSAFAEFKMTRSFFSSYIFSDPDDNDSLCKVTMRSCVNVFKNLHNLDKQVENCEIRMKPDATVVIFQLKFTNAPVKKYYLPVIESEKLEANVPCDTQNKLTASSKMLTSSIKNFRTSEDEITIRVEKDRTFIKNHIEVNKDLQSMRTELCFHPTEFETYSVLSPSCVTFCFKELRAVLLFAEPSNLSVSLSFSSPGKPILFQVPNPPAYEANYVVSTLNANAVNLEMNLARHSRTQPQISQPLRTLQEGRNTVFSFVDETEQHITQDSETDQQSLPQTNHLTLNKSTRTEINSNKDEEPSVRKSVKRKNSEIDSFPLSDGVESFYLNSSSSLLPQKLSDIEKTNAHSFTENIAKSDDPIELVKIIFSRCFKQINILEKICGNDVILADTSDTELV